MKSVKILVLLFACFIAQSKVQAAVEYEELSYEDLVQQLSAAREPKKTGPVLMKHMGLGLVSSYSTVTENGKDFYPAMNGFEVSMGTDLNSQKVRGELAFRDFFEKETISQKYSMREILIQGQFRPEINQRLNGKVGGGLSIRMLGFYDLGQKVEVNDTSSLLALAAGLEMKLSSSVSIGAEAGTHFPFGSPTADRSSFEYGLKLDSHF